MNVGYTFRLCSARAIFRYLNEVRDGLSGGAETAEKQIVSIERFIELSTRAIN